MQPCVVHCRASARPARDPDELTTDEAMHFIDTVHRLGSPLLVLTGGDPLKRPDTIPLLRYAASTGLRVALTPSGTPLMTPQVLEALYAAGLARLAVSVDGSAAEVHDRFRGVAGSFAWTVRMLHAEREIGLSTQVNTTIAQHNIHALEALAALVGSFGIALWSVFFVVPVGRARVRDLVSPGQIEEVLRRLYDLSTMVSFAIKATAAPHYRRVVAQRRRAERRAAEPDSTSPSLTDGIGLTRRGGIIHGRGVNDGKGFLFVSHRGEIYPSGFLPVGAGNVRTHELADVYRHNDMFRALRDPDRLKGKCGACEFRHICGGSRARAYAMTGDYLEADPACAYLPAACR